MSNVCFNNCSNNFRYKDFLDYSRSNENEQQPQVVQKIQTALSRQQSTLRFDHYLELRYK